MELNDIEKALTEDRWTFDLIFPFFRTALVAGLAPQWGDEADLEKVPVPLLASAYYRQSSVSLHQEIGGKRLGVGDVEVVDSEVKLQPAFWEEAIRTLVGEDGKLSDVTDTELEHIRDAIQEIEATNGKELFKYVPYIVIYEGTEWIASSQPHYIGSILIHRSLIGTNVLAENIVHELAHQELFGLNLIDRLIRPEADNHLVYAPFQRTERPPIGRLHAAHALYRICDYLKAGKAESLGSNVECLKKTVATFEPNELTEFGSFLINEMERKYA